MITLTFGCENYACFSHFSILNFIFFLVKTFDFLAKFIPKTKITFWKLFCCFWKHGSVFWNMCKKYISSILRLNIHKLNLKLLSNQVCTSCSVSCFITKNSNPDRTLIHDAAEKIFVLGYKKYKKVKKWKMVTPKQEQRQARGVTTKPNGQWLAAIETRDVERRQTKNR